MGLGEVTARRKRKKKKSSKSKKAKKKRKKKKTDKAPEPELDEEPDARNEPEREEPSLRRLKVLGDEFVRIDAELAELKQQKKELSEDLLPGIAKHGENNKLLVLDDGSRLTLITSGSKRVSKGGLIDHFGKAKAEKFWDTLEVSTSTYISVK